MVLVAVAAGAGFAIWQGVTGLTPKTLTDIRQERLDVAAPPLSDSGVGQTLVCRQSNLCAVEVLLVIHEESRTPESPGVITFHLRETPTATTDLVTIPVDTDGWAHNTPYTFSFPPLADSAGRAYAVVLTAEPGTPVTVWAESVDTYADGSLIVDGEPRAGDLYFKTYVQYTPLMTVTDTLAVLPAALGLAVPLVLLLLLPGLLLSAGLLSAGLVSADLVPARLNALERVCLWPCLSLAVWPVLFLLTLLPGVRFGPALAWGFCAVLLAAAGALLVATRGRGAGRWLREANTPVGWGLLVLFLVTLLVRFAQVRGLVAPCWIDPVDHALILRRFLGAGGIPASYEPLLPVPDYLHHYGFYTVAAMFHWLTGLDVSGTLLILGQVIGALVVPATYLLAARLSRRPLAGLVAALAAGLISTFPAYYVSWGRYTQLTAMILLPAALVCTMLALESRRTNWRLVVLAALTTAAVLLTHYRVFVFYACFVAPYVLYTAYRWRAWRPLLGRLALHVGVVLLIAGPWLWRLAVRWFAGFIAQGTLVQTLSVDPAYNDVPWGYLTAGWNRELAALAFAGALVGLWRGRRLAALMALWLAVLVIVTNTNRLGLPNTFVINNGTLLIAVYLPLAVLVGYLVDAVARWLLRRLAGRGRRVAVGLVALALLGVGLRTGWAMIPIVNPVTVLIEPEDLPAMAWIRQHTPPTARFLINGHIWPEGEFRDYVGSDGGYWVWHLAERETTVPPLAYAMAPADYRDGVNALMQAVNEDPALDSPDLRRRLREAGVTHVYIGARGGAIRPEALAQQPYCRVVYQQGPVWVFELVNE